VTYLIDTDCLSLLRRKGRSRKLEAFVLGHGIRDFVVESFERDRR